MTRSSGTNEVTLQVLEAGFWGAQVESQQPMFLLSLYLT